MELYIWSLATYIPSVHLHVIVLPSSHVTWRTVFFSIVTILMKLIFQSRCQKTVAVKSLIVNILGFAGHILSLSFILFSLF